MSNTLGKQMKITLFGESHGAAIGCVLDGVPGGIFIDEEFMQSQMNKRKAKDATSTSRQESDQVEILSGVKDGTSEGAPIALLIRNENVKKEDYTALEKIPRPSHADYSAHIKYQGYEDASGGGHFSGRLTAPIVAAGSICLMMLKEKNISLATHIKNLHGIEDRDFVDIEKDINLLNQLDFGVLDEAKKEAMISAIIAARNEQDSLGGILETVIIGLEAGIGSPLFDSLESKLAHAMFAIGAIKGIEFGSGFGFANMKGSQANDPLYIENNQVLTKTNHNGGINGGISNGMPIIFHTVVKPTPSIGKKQDSINLETMENTEIEIKGRHDPAIIHRARVVQDSMTAIVLCDLLLERFGEIWK